MNAKRTTSARGQRGRTVQKRQTNSRALLYGIVAIVIVAGLVLVGVMAMRSNTNTAGSGSSSSGQIVSTIPLDSLPARGSANAPVTVVEYGDFQCPACGYFATQLEPTFIKQYIDTGKVRLLFHDFPLSQHQNAVIAAEAAHSAGDQGKFWEMHDLLYNKQSEWENSTQPEQIFATYAQQLGLDVAQFQAALNTHKHRADIQAAGTAAGKAGVNSTPTFTINGKPYDMNGLQSAVDAALAQK